MAGPVVNKCFPEFCFFSKCNFDFHVQPVALHRGVIEFYMLRANVTDECLVVEIDRRTQIIQVLNIYGEELFSGVRNESDSNLITFQTRDGLPFGLIRNEKITDLKNDVKYWCDYDEECGYFVHGSFPAKHPWSKVQRNATYKSPVFRMTWDGEKVSSKQIHSSLECPREQLNLRPEAELDSIKALIAMKALEVGITDYFSNQNFRHSSFTYFEETMYKTSTLQGLESIGSCTLLARRVMKGTTWCHYVESYTDNSCQLGLVVEVDQCGAMYVSDPEGYVQFYAANVNSETGTRVGLNSLIDIGFVNDGKLFDKKGCKLMKSSFTKQTCDEICFSIRDLEGQLVCEIEADNAGVNIDMDLSQPQHYKALILAHCIQVAFNFYPFESGVQRKVKSSSKSRADFYAASKDYIRANPLKMPSLEHFKSGNLQLSNAGQSVEKGVSYFEVSEICNKTAKLLLVFEVVERYDDIHATAFDAYHEPYFSIYGLWGEDRDLVVNYTDVFGMQKDEKFYMRNGKHVWSEQQTRNSHRVVTAPKDCKQDLVAEIFQDCSSLAIRCNVRQSEKLALILSYALKLAYCAYGIYKDSSPSEPYNYYTNK